MFLKRLELHGFKSFAARTTLEFSPGITAIVGPNGSGKSNVADAIRWVLGEQSMRQLRGKKSDDVIFAGGASRGPMQMAEVGLVLDNSAGWLPSEFTEVTVARRSFRSGETEYLTSGQRVRLRDVLLLLAQARIGHDSYTVIGQGLVDAALSLRAEERRSLFEDAAGIRQFQTQRSEAEQKLGLTSSNLARLRDILGEIEPRLAPLAEQARRAREYTTARQDLTGLLRRYFRQQWGEAQAAREQAELHERAQAERIAQLTATLAAARERAQDLQQRREALQAEAAHLRRERGETAGRAQAAERDLAVARERLASLERQRADLDGEQAQQQSAATQARELAAQLEAQIQEAERQVEATTADFAALEREQHTARQEIEREEARLRAAQRDGIQVQARLGAAQTEYGRLQRQLGERNRQLAARQESAAQAAHKLEQAERLLAERRQAFETARAEVESLVAQREALAEELAEGQAELERLRASVADAQRERRALEDRLALLEEWRSRMEGYSEGVRALLQSPADARPPLLGILGQMVTAPEGLETALEVALGSFVGAAVVATLADAQATAAWLRQQGAGHALLVWCEGQPTPPAAADPMPTPDGADLLGYAADLLHCAPELRTAAQRLLAGAYIVRSSEVARARWGEDAPPVPVVTLEGEVFTPHGWMRRGGRAAQAARDSGLLERERALRTLPAEIERLAHSITEQQALYDRAQALQTERKAWDERLRREVRRHEEQAQEIARAVTTVQREHERMASESQLGQTLSEQLAAEVRGLEQEVAASAERVAEQERAQQEAAEQVEDLTAALDELQASNRAAQDEVTRLRTALALQRQEVKTLAQRAEHARTQLREVEAQLGRREERLAQIAEQHTALGESGAALEHEIAQHRERIRTLGEDLRAREAALAGLEAQTRDLEQSQSAEQQELARQEVHYREALLTAQRARDAVEALASQIREELAEEEGDDALATLLAAPEEAAEPLTPEEAARMRRAIEQLRGRLRHLGGYDPEAPQAYEELHTRYEFLRGQITDMEQASANLRAIIAELDVTMRRQFEETFKVVNERFQRHFVTLFSGGAARLELTAPRRQPADEEDELAEPAVARRPPSFGGVEVFVQIPGKRVQDLSLLSGGERAMVSAALLFALLETNPPPFCLLDEVDAALDEANVVRFCDILRALAEQTQFIVITHNRVTMTHADAIYGVSMGTESVSRIVSMRLAEAVASAATRGG